MIGFAQTLTDLNKQIGNRNKFLLRMKSRRKFENVNKFLAILFLLVPQIDLIRDRVKSWGPEVVQPIGSAMISLTKSVATIEELLVAVGNSRQ